MADNTEGREETADPKETARILAIWLLVLTAGGTLMIFIGLTAKMNLFM